ncbi:Pentatricopeptide repeat [Macleaya cordata]|uniref:Pentatricopeptide repeat n=1 Tax=Macleaya cordata TaxID=56857 RepID=A0A200R8S6_MACCD|nr:Pentatricopeptide repeat [Macleaya cordata]
MNSHHAKFLKLGLDTNPIIATRLLNAYVNSQHLNSLTYAHQLFEQVPIKDTFLWSSIISAYTRSGNSHKALHLFSQMLFQNQPNHYVFATVARACGSNQSHLQLGKNVHGLVIKSGFLPNIVVETSFVDMYAKCGEIECSLKKFDEMSERNIISWNAMIAAYVLNGMEINGLELFYRMKCVELQVPDEFTVATVLAGCARINDLKLGIQVHAYLLTVGLQTECDSAVCNMYFRCREISSAKKIFMGREENAMFKLIMIKGYVFNGRHHDALKLVACDDNFVEVFMTDLSVIASVLTACTALSLLRIGRQVHGLIITLLSSYRSKEDDIVVTESALINMYCKCSSIIEARRVFNNSINYRSVSHWNSMITGYIYNGLLEDAKRSFKEMPEKNVVSWTALISGYVQYGLLHEALRVLIDFYSKENDLAMQGNCLTLTAALEACSLLTVLELGKQIHGKLVRTTVSADINNVFVGTALIDMYSKSGNLHYAERVFSRMETKNVVSWTSMISGYAIHGLGFRALEAFEQMLEMGIEPNLVTFISVLSSCRHCGLIVEGMQYFKLMKDKYGMVPRGDHYACVIDLLGRAGRLDEAWSLLEEIEESEGNDEFYGGSIRGALLGACGSHGNVEMGSRVAEKMLEKKEQVSETYITLSNIYAMAGMWDEAYRVRERWRDRGCDVGEAGQSRIHIHLPTK